MLPDGGGVFSPRSLQEVRAVLRKALSVVIASGLPGLLVDLTQTKKP
jgi:hypothetical protein